MEADRYKTLESESHGIYKEKGSRFLSFAYPVTSTEEIKTILDHLRKEYHDARHHCYAYRLGDDTGEHRYQDDGEPSGTAGKPIYGQILSLGLTNVLVVVIRYFGGIKLGTGGLIQAYRASARDALESGRLIEKVWTQKLQVRFSYTVMNEVMRCLKMEDARIIDMHQGDEPFILLEISRGKIAGLEKKLNMLESVQHCII